METQFNRRTVLSGFGATAVAAAFPALPMPMEAAPRMLLSDVIRPEIFTPYVRDFSWFLHPSQWAACEEAGHDMKDCYLVRLIPPKDPEDPDENENENENEDEDEYEDDDYENYEDEDADDEDY